VGEKPVEGQCAASAAMEWLPKGAEVEGNRPLGRLAYLEPKGEGESSMPVKRLNGKGCNVRRRKPCTYGEAGQLPNPSSTRLTTGPPQHP
jgi:hypothetical protein